MTGKLVIALGCLLVATVLVEIRAAPNNGRKTKTPGPGPVTRSAVQDSRNCLKEAGNQLLNSLQRGTTCKTVHDLSKQAYQQNKEVCDQFQLGPNEIEVWATMESHRNSHIVKACTPSKEELDELVTFKEAEPETANESEQTEAVQSEQAAVESVEDLAAEEPIEADQNDQTAEEPIELGQSDETDANESTYGY